MSPREFALNIALLAAILYVGWLIFSLQPTEHVVAYSEARLKDVIRESATDTEEVETTYGGQPRVVRGYPSASVPLFETLITPTPTPTPPPLVFNTPLPLKQAMTAKWAFLYCFADQASWRDSGTNTDFVLKIGETREVQHGKFTYTVKLTHVDNKSFQAQLQTVKIVEEGREHPPENIDVGNQTVYYSLINPSINP